MVSIKCSIPLASILLLIIVIIAGNVVNADKCRQWCGSIAPQTTVANMTCYKTGDIIEFIVRMDWDDGSYTIFSISIDIHLVIGSCCSHLTYSTYATGVALSGMFSGQKFYWTSIASGDRDRQACNGCESSAGISLIAEDIRLSFGTKGVGNWIECVGNATALYSPALTPESQTVYSTFYAVFNDCTDCVESC